MHLLRQKFAFDSTTSVCLLACSATLYIWMRSVVGYVAVGQVVFFLLMPVVFYCAGCAFLSSLQFRVQGAHAFPLAFLVGAIVSILLAFLLDVCLSIPLRVIDALVLGIVFAAYIRVPALVRRTEAAYPRWIASFAIMLSLLGASLWTQDQRPHSFRDAEAVVVRPWADIFVHAQIVGQLRADQSILRLGDPDQAGRGTAFYHYASYILPASLEAWTPSATAHDVVVAIWIPMGFLLLGLAAFSLAAEWWNDLAGLGAVAGVLLIPDGPAYAIPITWFSFHWLSVVSPGLLYGTAAATAALVLVSRAVNSKSDRLLTAGLSLLVANVLLKAHIAIVSLPLGVTFVLLFKQGLTRKHRLVLAGVLTAVGCFSVLVLDRLGIGPSLLPSLQISHLVSYWDQSANRVAPGLWRELLIPQLTAAKPAHALALLTVVLGAPLGGLLILWPSLLALKAWRRMLTAVDSMPAMGLGIYLACVLLLPPNERGTIDELWHRPFVWLYFLVSTWSFGQLIAFIPGEYPGRRWPAFVVAGATVALAYFPLRQGQNIEQSIAHASGFTNTKVPAGLVQAGNFLRTHSEQEDVVQNLEGSTYPILSSYAERRSYLGRSPNFWHEFYAGSAIAEESARRNAVLMKFRQARTEDELEKLRRVTGIRWYVAAPGEVLGWPEERQQAPVFISQGYQVYDLHVSAARPTKPAPGELR